MNYRFMEPLYVRYSNLQYGTVHQVLKVQYLTHTHTQQAFHPIIEASDIYVMLLVLLRERSEQAVRLRFLVFT